MPRDIIYLHHLLPTRARKYSTFPSPHNSSVLGLFVRTQGRSSTKSESKPLSIKQAWSKRAPGGGALPISTKPTLRTAAQKITKFQAKLLKIRSSMDNQVAALDSVAKLLDVEKDRLHPLVHCKYILQLDTTSSLQALLQAISDKTPKGQERTTYEHNTAIWLESRILAVQLWVVKRLLIQIQLFETENRTLHIQIQDSLSGILIRMQYLSKEVAALRDNFHRIRPGRTEELLQEEWAKNFFVDGAKNVNSGDVGLESTIQPPQLAVLHKFGSGEPTSHSILLENLSIVAAYSRQESAIWKIERFLSRVENIYYRVSRAITYLDRLAQDLQVTEDRTHPVVSCKYILQLNSFASLDMVLRILRKRTPKNQVELQREMGQTLWLDSRLPEVQLEVVKMRLWAFHLTVKGQALSPQQKNLIRSIRGRIKIAHGLLHDSREEFGSYGPQGKFEIGGSTLGEEKRDNENIVHTEKV